MKIENKFYSILCYESCLPRKTKFKKKIQYSKLIKNYKNIQLVQKNYTVPPMILCTYLQSFEKIQQCVFDLKCEK